MNDGFKRWALTQARRRLSEKMAHAAMLERVAERLQRNPIMVNAWIKRRDETLEAAIAIEAEIKELERQL